MGIAENSDTDIEAWMRLMAEKLAEQANSKKIPSLGSASGNQGTTKSGVGGVLESVGGAIDSWNKGKWAMEEENNRRAGEGADRTMNLINMIPSMYSSRNNARKESFGLAGMAGQ